MRESLIKYILEEIIGDADEELMADDDLLNSGLIDSLGIMRLIGFIENEHELKIPPQDMVIENFMSVDAIAMYIEKVKAR
jgi:acyl carrier protein